MLFKHSFHRAIASGAITVTYRAWQRARVSVGNRYRLNAEGVVAVDEIREMSLAEITDAAARAGGFPSRDALLRQLLPARGGHRPATVFEIRFHYVPDPRAPVADVSAGNVRRLKALGLTVSHDTGYTLTSLGARVLRERDRTPRAVD